MEELVLALVRNIFNWTRFKWIFYKYNRRGKKNSSFVDYGIAICYENKYEARYTRDANGRGEVLIDAGSIFRIFSNEKGTYSIEYIDALCVEPEWKGYVKSVCNECNGDYRFGYHYDDNGNNQIDICCEIEADPKEKNARLYINGLYTKQL